MNLITLALVALLPAAGQHVHPQPSAGQPGAPSALTSETVKQLLDGDGMGLARPAEVHNYPGPKHVLDLAKELALTTEQQKEIAAIRQRVLDQARPLGKAIVDAERALDAAFTGGALTETALQKQLEAIGALQAELRLVHLRAHLATRPLLTAEQVRRYYELRK